MIATLYGQVVRAVFLAASVAPSPSPSPSPSTSGIESPPAIGTGDPLARAAFVVSLAAVFVALAAVLYSRRQAIAAEKSVPPTPLDVAWQIEPYSAREYLLRNTGVKPATGVKVTTGPRPFQGALRPRWSTDEPVPSGASMPFLLVGTYGNSDPHELLVSWDGNPEGVWVAIPPKTKPQP